MFRVVLDLLYDDKVRYSKMDLDRNFGDPPTEDDFGYADPMV